MLEYSQLTRASLVTQLLKNTPAMQETLVQFLGWEDPLEKGSATHSSILGLSLWGSGKESAFNAGGARDTGWMLDVPGSGRSPGVANGYPLQYSCLENPMDRGAWRATVHGLARVGHDLATKPPPIAIP